MQLKNIGNILEEQRKALGLSVEETSKMLKIRKAILVGLEAGDSSIAPSYSYLIKYIRTYAMALGLNGDHLISYLSVPKSPKKYFPLPTYTHESLYFERFICISSLILLIIIYLVWYQIHYYGSLWKHSSHSVIEALNTSHYILPALPEPTNNVPSTATRWFRSTLSSQFQAVVIARGEAVIQVYDSNHQLLIQKVLLTGETYFIPQEPGIVIVAKPQENVDVMVGDEFTHLEDIISQRLTGTKESIR